MGRGGNRTPLSDEVKEQIALAARNRMGMWHTGDTSVA